MSDTPKTDIASDQGFGQSEMVYAYFARDLERENTKLRASLEHMLAIVTDEFPKGNRFAEAINNARKLLE